jgi:hypothetical protein
MDQSRRIVWTATFTFAVVQSVSRWAAGECVSTHWTDRNGHEPKANTTDKGGSGEMLKCMVSSADLQPSTGPSFGHFKVYYNNCASSGCVHEQISTTDANNIAQYLECAHAFLLDPTMSSSSLAFRDPIPSIWVYNLDKRGTADDNIPAWILKESGGGGGSPSPQVSFPAKGRLRQPISHNAVHELGHVVEWGYNAYLAGGCVDLVNEGLPTFFESTLRNFNVPRYSGGTDICRDKDDFLDLSQTSLRNAAYCDGANFWHFLADFTRLRDPEFYVTADLVPACQTYLSAVTNPATSSGTRKMRRMRGRDVIQAVLESLRTCHPRGRETPACTHNHGYAVACAGSQYPNGCVPRSLVDGRSRDADACNGDQEQHDNGEVFMPLVMDRIDEVFSTRGFSGSNPRFGDGIGKAIFRQFLESNYEHASAGPSTYTDGQGYALRSYGAHYHEFDISSGTVLVTLTRNDDLPQWAYGVFYKKDGNMTAVQGWDAGGYRGVSAWKNRRTETLRIPSRAGFDKAVVIVTALGGIFEKGDDYNSMAAWGHYQLSSQRESQRLTLPAKRPAP